MVISSQTGLVADVLERVEHRRELPRADRAVEAVGERLEVDVRRVHVGEELGARLGADVSRRDRHRLDPARVAGVAVSTAYSRKMTGSLYVKATLRQPSRSAVAAISSGDAASASVSISRDFEMSQFWQNRHARLQPAVPNESTAVPGRKWFSGFFSMGSTQKPLDRP